jgi:prepilin-type N-terminal cleavage/methylation domain-containing protein
MTIPRQQSGPTDFVRRGFTLVELLVVMVIASMIAATAMIALWSAQEEARIQRTRAQIAKIHEILLPHFEAYATRPVRLPPNFNPAIRQKVRLLVLRDYMRLEFPDRRSDLLTPPLPFASMGANQIQVPHLRGVHERRLAVFTGGDPDNWTPTHQQAECLYLILAALRHDDRDALSYFRESEIGDLDGDGVPEILDSWGNPIGFLRWAPGYSENPLNGGVTPSFIQTQDALASPDPFDPQRIDPRWSNSDPIKPFLLFPLVFSAGSFAFVLPSTEIDYGLELGAALTYADPGSLASATDWYRAMDPYHQNGGNLVGSPRLPATGERLFDNLITNHDLETP